MKENIINEQIRICKKFNSSFISTDENLMVGIDSKIFLGKFPINGLRHFPDGQGSGWFFWAGGEIPQEDKNFFEPMHIKNLNDKLPNILKYLALEPGFRIQVDSNGYEDVWFDDNLLKN